MNENELKETKNDYQYDEFEKHQLNFKKMMISLEHFDQIVYRNNIKHTQTQNLDKNDFNEFQLPEIDNENNKNSNN